MMPSLLSDLVHRGDQVAVENGKLVVIPASGKPVPKSWLIQNRSTLLEDIAKTTNSSILEYLSYKTGRYGSTLAEGLTLQFLDLLNQSNPYVIFNVELDRLRSSESAMAGSPLPEGHFRIKQKSAFREFWDSTGLVVPNRLSKYHQHMGTLSRIVFSGTINPQNNRLDARSLAPSNIPSSVVKHTVTQNYAGTTRGQLEDNTRTTIKDKMCDEYQASRGSQESSATCGLKRGTTVNRKKGLVDIYNLNQYCSACADEGCAWCSNNKQAYKKRPEEQSDAEWWNDYYRGSQHS